MTELPEKVREAIAAGPQRLYPCPRCKESGSVMGPSFMQTGATVEQDCRTCYGTGKLLELPEAFARRIARLAIEESTRELRARLEIDPQAPNYDGIACRDETIRQQDKQLAELRAEKDGAYLERNHLVAALSKLYPSGLRITNIPGWSADWHGCCMIDLPTGQISYHFHDSQAHLFAHLKPYAGEWDGHDKDTVHARLAALAIREAKEGKNV